MAAGETMQTLVRWHDEHTLELVYRGDVTAAEVGRVLAAYRRLRKGRHERFQIGDVVAMTRLEAAASGLAFELLRVFPSRAAALARLASLASQADG